MDKPRAVDENPFHYVYSPDSKAGKLVVVRAAPGRLEGVVADYADLARLGHVSQARISQIMSLVYLAPDLQEEILFWPPTLQGRDPIALVDLVTMVRCFDWQEQRRRWRGRRKPKPRAEVDSKSRPGC